MKRSRYLENLCPYIVALYIFVIVGMRSHADAAGAFYHKSQAANARKIANSVSVVKPILTIAWNEKNILSTLALYSKLQGDIAYPMVFARQLISLSHENPEASLILASLIVEPNTSEKFALATVDLLQPQSASTMRTGYFIDLFHLHRAVQDFYRPPETPHVTTAKDRLTRELLNRTEELLARENGVSALYGESGSLRKR